MKAIYKDNKLLGWHISEDQVENFRKLGFEIREVTDLDVKKELSYILQKEIDELEFDSAESIE